MSVRLVAEALQNETDVVEVDDWQNNLDISSTAVSASAAAAVGVCAKTTWSSFKINL